MPLYRPIADKPVRVAQNLVTLVAANSDTPRATLLTVPGGRKFTVLGVGTDQNSASVDLIAFKVTGKENPQLIDLVTQRIATDERIVIQAEVLNAGESLVVGIRNRTGGALTPQLFTYYHDEPA